MLSAPAREKGERRKNRRRGRRRSKSPSLVLRDPDRPPSWLSPRARRVTFPPQSSGLSIQEPPRDIKGKKRALPEATSDEDTSVASSSTLKRPRTATSSYSLRSRSDLPLTEPLEMPKKTRYVLRCSFLLPHLIGKQKCQLKGQDCRRKGQGDGTRSLSW